MDIMESVIDGHQLLMGARRRRPDVRIWGER
jgi:hypothetical protein